MTLPSGPGQSNTEKEKDKDKVKIMPKPWYSGPKYRNSG
jgi:hypothetical protein